MKQRHDDLLAKHSKEISKEKKDKTIFKNFGVVGAYNHGTTGYRIKEGKNKDKVVGHIKIESKSLETVIDRIEEDISNCVVHDDTHDWGGK